MFQLLSSALSPLYQMRSATPDKMSHTVTHVEPSTSFAISSGPVPAQSIQVKARSTRWLAHPNIDEALRPLPPTLSAEKSFPEGSQSPPKACKSDPRGPQEARKSSQGVSQGGPKETPGPPRRPQEIPGDTQRPPKSQPGAKCNKHIRIFTF